METLASGGRLVAMELQQIQRHGIENLIQLATADIDKQANRRHERRQRRKDRLSLRHRYRARTVGIKHQANSVRTRFNGGQCVIYAGNSTDLAAND
ncbi:hypothetical protein D9M68_793000 [compost metagenome]